MNIKNSAYCNVKIYRLTRSRDKRILNRELIQKKHNMVLTSGLNQLRDACNGTAWQLSSIGLGNDGTAVTAADTWGLGSLSVAAPTTSYYKDNLFRATYLLEEDEQNGETIREVWISPDTTGPPGGEDAYARVVIDDIAKTSSYAYLFIFDCTFNGSCVATGWNMLAAQAASAGAYSFACDQVRLGSGTKAESTSDTVLELPWVMTPLDAGSTATVDGTLTINFTIPPDTYVGNTVREVGLYYELSGPLITNALPTGSRVSSTGLVWSWDGSTARAGAAKNFADGTGATDGTLGGSVTLGGATGIKGAATTFDGSDDIIGSINLGALTKGTMRSVFKHSTLKAEFISMLGTNTATPAILTYNNVVYVYFPGATGMTNTDFSAQLGMAANEVYDVVFVWSGAAYALYLNGVLSDSKSSGCTFPASDGVFQMGKHSGVLDGVIYETEIWTEALTATQVLQLHQDLYGWASGITSPGLYTRDLVATPYEVVPEEGATVRCVLTWESG